MKKLCSILLGLMLFVSIGGTVLAEDGFPPSEQLTTRWWPGNPNPQPGTEDWLYQNYSKNLGNNASQVVAESCALSALVGGSFTAAEATIGTWVKGKKFSLGSFVLTFGIGAASGYAQCLVVNGITNQ